MATDAGSAAAGSGSEQAKNGGKNGGGEKGGAAKKGGKERQYSLADVRDVLGYIVAQKAEDGVNLGAAKAVAELKRPPAMIRTASAAPAHRARRVPACPLAAPLRARR